MRGRAAIDEEIEFPIAGVKVVKSGLRKLSIGLSVGRSGSNNCGLAGVYAQHIASLVGQKRRMDARPAANIQGAGGISVAVWPIAKEERDNF